MTDVFHFLFPTDTVGPGDFTAALTAIAIVLVARHKHHPKPRPIQARTLRRINQRIDEQEQQR